MESNILEVRALIVVDVLTVTPKTTLMCFLFFLFEKDKNFSYERGTSKAQVYNVSTLSQLVASMIDLTHMLRTFIVSGFHTVDRKRDSCCS